MCDKYKDDYKIHLTAAKINITCDNFEKVKELLDKAHEIIECKPVAEGVKNALKQKAITLWAQWFSERAKRALKDGDKERALQLNKEGYMYVEDAVRTLPYRVSRTCVEIVNICHTLAIDKGFQPWRIRQHPGDSTDYLSKAIEYGAEAEKGLNKTPWLYSMLCDCYSLQKNHREALMCAKKAVQADKCHNFIHIKSFLIHAMRFLGPNARDEIVQTMKPVCEALTEKEKLAQYLLKLPMSGRDKQSIVRFMQDSDSPAMREVANLAYRRDN